MPWSPRALLTSPRTYRPLAVALGTRVAIFLVAAWGVSLGERVDPPRFLLHGQQQHPAPLVDLFQRWDSYWFLNIARHGYQYHGVQEQLTDVVVPERETNITPFPLYPLLLAGGGRLLGDASVAGLVISLLCYALVVLVLYRAVAAVEGDAVALRAVLLLSLYPTGFIYNAIYSESLFLLLALLALRAAERGRAIAAGLAGAGAALTRLAGGLLAPALLVELAWGARRRVRERASEGDGAPPAATSRALAGGLLAAALTASGCLAYFLYLRWLTGSFWSYFTAQLGWHKGLVPLWTGLAELVRGAASGDPAGLANLAAAALFIPLAVAGARALPLGQALYLGLGVLMPLCSSNLLGLPRYLMVLYPGFILLARWCSHPALEGAALAAFSLGQGPLLLSWLRWEQSL